MLARTTFLTTVNPDLDLKTLFKPRKTQEILLKTPRETFVIQPPLGPNEKLPAFLALEDAELAISSTGRPLYTHVKELNLYIPDRHSLILQLVRLEISSTNSAEDPPHGSPDAAKTDCNGPLCRRQRREARAEAARTREYRRAYKSKTRPVHRQLTPANQAADPLLTAFTIQQFKTRRTSSPLTSEQKLYTNFKSLRHVISYLSLIYPRRVL